MAAADRADGMNEYFGSCAASTLGSPEPTVNVGGVVTSRPAGYGMPGRPGGQVMQYVGSRTFYRDGDKWVDSRYKAEQETIKVKAFSKEYFDLVAANEDLGKCFALGSKVIVVLDDKAYETTE